jgi:hypothetical protein
MAAPVAGAPLRELAQVAQQAKKAEGAPKTSASKFDQAMVDKAQGVDAAKDVQKVQGVDKAQKVDQVLKADKVDATARATPVKKDDPVTAGQKIDKPRSSIEATLTQLESRTSAMDKFIADAVGGKVKLNPQQLLGLQARVSEYSLELDLTGKVVEKATSGLKDTLHTQV